MTGRTHTRGLSGIRIELKKNYIYENRNVYLSKFLL